MNAVPQVLITQSLFTGSEYFVFRPIGNDNYKEIKFEIVNNKIKENPLNKLWAIERIYIEKKYLCK